MFAKLFLRSVKSSDRHKMAMISDAAVISKPVSLGTPDVVPPNPTTMFLKALSFISITRFHVTWRAAMPKEFVVL